LACAHCTKRRADVISLQRNMLYAIPAIVVQEALHSRVHLFTFCAVAAAMTYFKLIQKLLMLAMICEAMHAIAEQTAELHANEGWRAAAKVHTQACLHRRLDFASCFGLRCI
jgi:hypothetical protein